MRINLEVNNLTKRKISQPFLAQIARNTVKCVKSKADFLNLSVVIVGRNEIKKLNRIYRKKNKETDILSFNYGLGYNAKKKDARAVLEGELAICLNVIAESARKHGIVFEKELAFVFSHGILHLAGYSHSKEMYSIQDKIAGKY